MLAIKSIIQVTCHDAFLLLAAVFRAIVPVVIFRNESAQLREGVLLGCGLTRRGFVPFGCRHLGRLELLGRESWRHALDAWVTVFCRGFKDDLGDGVFRFLFSKEELISGDLLYLSRLLNEGYNGFGRLGTIRSTTLRQLCCAVGEEALIAILARAFLPPVLAHLVLKAADHRLGLLRRGLV